MSSLAGVRVLAKLIHSATIGSTFSRMKSASLRSPAEAGFGNLGGLVNAISFGRKDWGPTFAFPFHFVSRFTAYGRARSRCLGERVRVILAGTVLSFKRAASNHPTQAS